MKGKGAWNVTDVWMRHAARISSWLVVMFSSNPSDMKQAHEFMEKLGRVLGDLGEPSLSRIGQKLISIRLQYGGLLWLVVGQI